MSRFAKILKAVRPGNVGNVRVILLSVFAATTFWFFNALNENYSTTLQYPLEFIYDRDDYIAVDPIPENVQINVSGLGWNLFRNSLGIKVSPLEIRLDDPTEVKRIVAASVPSLISDQLDELQLNYVLTDTLFLNIDYRTSKKFKLLIDSTNISLEDNYRIINPVRFTPDSVELEGPSGVINDLPDSILVGIPQKAIDENFNEEISINLPNGRLIRRNPPTVNVVFGVEEFLNREVMIPLKIENIPDKAYIETESVKVSYKVRASFAEEIAESEIKAVADFNTMDQSDSTILPFVKEYPEKITDVELDTTRIKVFFNE
ncbi:hypothetical protein E1176_03525 [Fulvivirga sp. RKSG066]|uniref:hypothetical protein n=1 Tax=Fulvivirga aurantia TaxID=2529383 RepID=UPI0012BBF039|nr:hypothetical protein [Fulvivirga aurantia]MTI20081.1 hypothetical protein [Fulvivirga aurantia]